MTAPKTPRHFLQLLDLTHTEAMQILARGIELKDLHRQGVSHQPLRGKTLAMLFEKASTRTRVSFEAGMVQLGGHALFLSARDTQLGRGEPLADSARVISRMVDAILIRTHAHSRIDMLAKHASVPVINGLSDSYHPCQLLADIQTFHEHRGPIKNQKVAFIGDGNNVCNSYVNASFLYEFQLSVACPDGYEPSATSDPKVANNVTLVRSPHDAVQGASLVVTDVWASMGQEGEDAERQRAFSSFRVDRQLLSLAAPDAIFMHCLPAHRGEEVTADVIDGPQSVVWNQAENRLHAQKALLEFLLSG